MPQKQHACELALALQLVLQLTLALQLVLGHELALQLVSELAIAPGAFALYH